ncbi:hypothetical protein JX265_001924 [Neoarthrinium moseri]|uniref:Uncharacterized protein n=1 Tax=Neoarthrinium moseri TaxID=1658444 RepID=A0A9P9WWE8_9PEZI|nr:hypothetical protein JX265_001924 [Neoarthrinium moseri]
MVVGAIVALFAKYTALLLVPYFLLLISYRIFFHPYRNFPGPAAAKASDSYASFYALSRRLDWATFRDQAVYGKLGTRASEKSRY